MRWILFAVFSVPLTLRAFADPPAPEAPAVPVLHAETRVVQIDVVVTDSQGKPVTDLSKKDFTVTDAGKPRAIDIFSVNRGESAPPAKLPASSLAGAPAKCIFESQHGVAQAFRPLDRDCPRPAQCCSRPPQNALSDRSGWAVAGRQSHEQVETGRANRALRDGKTVMDPKTWTKTGPLLR
jgi:hypothetical protein